MKHTFLGPHAVPEEAESNEAFLEEMIELLPEVKEYADFADIFVKLVYSRLKNLSDIWKRLKLDLKLKFTPMKLIH